MNGSTARPLVGLTGRHIAASALTTAAGWASAPVDAYFSDYALSVAAAGGLPVHLPLGVAPAEIAERLDALVLSGGGDVDPRAYGSVVNARSGVVDPARDAFEAELFSAMTAAGKPVLGVCRGAQLINVVLGGTLVDDLPDGVGESHGSYAYPRALRRHAVTFAPGSRAHALYGELADVNSFHHQAVDEPGQGVVITGRANDGVVEAFEIDGLDVLGVQWHPECFGADPAFSWVVEAARSNCREVAA